MAEDIKVIIEAILKDEKYKAGIKSINKELEDHSKKSSNIFSSLKSGWLAITAVITGTIIALKGFIEESIEAEDSQVMLAQALKNTGKYSKELMDTYKNQASELSKLIAIEDDQITKIQAILTMNGVQESKMRDLSLATADFAKATKMDLVSAAELVGKSIGSENNALGRYGIQIDTAGTKTQKTTEIIARLNEKFGGQAVAAANTFSGKIEQTKNIMDNFREAIGRGIIEGINPAIESFLKFTKTSQGMKELEDISKGVAIVFMLLGTSIVQSVSVIKAQLSIVITSISTVVNSIIKLVNKDLKGALDTLVGGAKKIAEEEKNIFLAFKDSAVNAITGVKNIIDETNQEIINKTVERNAQLVEINAQAQEEYLTFIGEQQTIELMQLENKYQKALDYAIKYGEDTKKVEEYYAKQKNDIKKKYDTQAIKWDDLVSDIRKSTAKTTTDAIIEGLTNENLAGKKATSNFIRQVGSEISGKLAVLAAAEAAQIFIPFIGPAHIPAAAALTAAAVGVKLIANKAASEVESYAVGSPDIPSDQIAQIHAGERIIPARMNIPSMSNEDFINATYRGIGMAQPPTNNTTNNNNAITNVNINGIGINTGLNTTVGELLNMADRMGSRTIFQRG